MITAEQARCAASQMRDSPPHRPEIVGMPSIDDVRRTCIDLCSPAETA